jgi:glycosyltransferase involved in cell wall biosynthesis
MTSLNILHVLRAPVGGLFRHVVDLTRGQAARGHRVGIVADLSTGGIQAEAVLASLRPHLALGLTRVAMSRQLGWRDMGAGWHVARRAAETQAHVVHGHGAKGGAYARSASRPAIRVYTPHGGSLHYAWSTPAGFLYLASEQALMRRTDLLLFESAHARQVLEAKLGRPRAVTAVVHNGVGAEDFAPVAADPQASDIVFVGELRALKGVDVLIEAIAALGRRGKNVTASIVGAGPDRAAFEALTTARGLARSVRFLGAMTARSAFALGRIVVVPSRAESLPYIVLEAAAAGLPLVATRVGGIGEIFGADAGALVSPGDAQALALAIREALENPTHASSAARRLQARVRECFSVDVMTESVLAAYAETMSRAKG